MRKKRPRVCADKPLGPDWRKRTLIQKKDQVRISILLLMSEVLLVHF
jgi:hypothetical protein